MLDKTDPANEQRREHFLAASLDPLSNFERGANPNGESRPRENRMGNPRGPSWFSVQWGKIQPVVRSRNFGIGAAVVVVALVLTSLAIFTKVVPTTYQAMKDTAFGVPGPAGNKSGVTNTATNAPAPVATVPAPNAAPSPGSAGAEPKIGETVDKAIQGNDWLNTKLNNFDERFTGDNAKINELTAKLKATEDELKKTNDALAAATQQLLAIQNQKPLDWDLVLEYATRKKK